MCIKKIVIGLDGILYIIWKDYVELFVLVIIWIWNLFFRIYVWFVFWKKLDLYFLLKVDIFKGILDFCGINVIFVIVRCFEKVVLGIYVREIFDEYFGIL